MKIQMHFQYSLFQNDKISFHFLIFKIPNHCKEQGKCQSIKIYFILYDFLNFLFYHALNFHLVNGLLSETHVQIHMQKPHPHTYLYAPTYIH